MVGFNNCDFDKKINLEESLCLMERKINELTEEVNRITEENTVIKEKYIEIERLFDFLIDEQGVKLPISYDESIIAVGTIFRTGTGELKFKTLGGEIKTIQMV